MREIRLRIERNKERPNLFDVQWRDEMGDRMLNRVTGDQLKRLVTTLVNRALQSLEQ